MFKLLLLIACVIYTTQASTSYGVPRRISTGYGAPPVSVGYSGGLRGGFRSGSLGGIGGGYGRGYGIRSYLIRGYQGPTTIHPGILTYYRLGEYVDPYIFQGLGRGYGGGAIVGGGIGGGRVIVGGGSGGHGGRVIVGGGGGGYGGRVIVGGGGQGRYGGSIHWA